MKKYIVEITETLQKQIEITASSKSEAIEKTKSKYNNQDIYLNENDLKEIKINVLKTIKSKDYQER